MKSLKKSLAFLVVLTMVLTTVAPVFAATPADVVGTDYETAVGNLAALGIISGDKETGNYRPSDSITRAEFAKIACYLLGLQTAAELASGTTKFKDAPASHWASGYINVAAEKGMIKGYPGGMFKPDENVTYAEAITILVRAIGMGEFVEKQGGTWPSNYLAAGSSAGLAAGVSGFAGDAKAIRGIIAELTWNTLGAEKWGPKEYTTAGITYGPLAKSLMEEYYKDYVYKNSDGKYDIKVFSKVKVSATQTSTLCEADEIIIDLSNQAKLKTMLGTAENSAKVEVVGTFNLISLSGLKVDLFFGKDNKIVNIKSVTPASDMIAGYIDSYADANNEIDVKATVDADDTKTYGFVASPSISINTVSCGTVDNFFDNVLPEIKDSTAKVTAILDGGKIATLKITVNDVFDYTAANMSMTAMKQFAVAEITKNNVVKNVATEAAGRGTMFDLDDLSDVDEYIVVKNGKVVTKSDIKVGDAVTYVKKSGLVYIMVSDVKVTGKIAKIGPDAVAADNDTRKEITIDSKVYAMPFDGSALMTKKNSIEEADVKDIDSTVTDFAGKDVTITLNTLGEIVFLSATVTAGSANLQLGVVSRALDGAGENFSVKIMGQDGIAVPYTVKDGKAKVIVANGDIDSSATYSKVEMDTILADTKDATEADAVVDDVYALSVGTMVLFEASADKMISAENLYLLSGCNVNNGDDFVVTNVAGIIDEVKNTNKKIDVGDTTYSAKAATTYVNVDVENIEKINSGWNSLSKVIDDVPTNLFENADTLYFVSDSDDALKAVFISVPDAEYLTSDDTYGIFVDSWSDSDTDWVKILVNGTAKEYKVADSVYDELEEGDLIIFNLDGETKYVEDEATVQVADQSAIEDLVKDDEANAYLVTGKDSSDADVNEITFKEAAERASGDIEKTVTIAKDAVVYDCRSGKAKAATFADISKDLYVVVSDYDTTDENYKIVVIMAE